MFLNQGKVRQFVKVNGERIKSINAKMEELAEEYFLKDDDGKIVKEEGADSKGNKQVVFKEGKTQEEYTKVLNEYMDTPCVINL